MKAILPRFRFSLRTLLMLMMASSVTLAVLLVPVLQARRQRAFMDRIAILGGRVTPYDSNSPDSRHSVFQVPGRAIARALYGAEALPPIGGVDFERPITDNDLAVLSDFPELAGLGIGSGKLTSAALAHLDSLPKLQSLELVDSQITAADLAHSKVGPQLTNLILRGPKADDGALVGVAGLPRLDRLQLVDAVLADRGVAAIAENDRLRWLTLYRCPNLTSAGLTPLAKLKELREFTVSGPALDDSSMAILDSMPLLERLTTSGTTVTDAGMTHLRGHNHLRSLEIGGPGITDVGIRDLCELPELKFLSLDSCRITNVGVRLLSELPKLKTLSVSNTKLTDADERELAQLVNLKWLRVGPRISRSAAKRIGAALPDCEVQWLDAQGGMETLARTGK